MMKITPATKKAAPQVESEKTTGFPSPAEDFGEAPLDLHDLVVRNQPATFFMRADTEDMQRSGVETNDLLVVDRSLDPRDGSLVVLMGDGEFMVKRCIMCRGRLVVADDHGSINVAPEALWGVVTYIVRQV